jgi:hypothetical protein
MREKRGVTMIKVLWMHAWKCHNEILFYVQLNSPIKKEMNRDQNSKSGEVFQNLWPHILSLQRSGLAVRLSCTPRISSCVPKRSLLHVYFHWGLFAGGQCPPLTSWPLWAYQSQAAHSHLLFHILWDSSGLRWKKDFVPLLIWFLTFRIGGWFVALRSFGSEMDLW